jgi:hypothetical protein
MTPIILLEDTIVALHPPSINLVLPPIFNYQLIHIFNLDRIMFAQALAITFHLSLGGLFGKVFEHLLGCLIPRTHPKGFWNYYRLLLPLLVGISLG